MQTIADLLVALLTWLGAFLSGWWLSLTLIPVAYALRQRVKPPFFEPPRAMAYGSIAILALVVVIIRSTVVGDPHPPWYTDDFGYALTADTFAHGRLTNPPHPMRAFFSSLYVLQTPTYNSMYQSGPAALAAAGQVLLHRRAAALWIACAAAACAVCWGAEAVAPIGIAWLAGLLVAMHPVVLEWMNHYHAAPFNAFAGALAIGGALRVRECRTWQAQTAMGIGIAVMANMRPYEGFVVAMIAFVLARRFVPLALGIAVCGLLWTALYNRAVTGDPFQLPYNAYNAHYLSAPNFIWQRPYPPRQYPTQEMEKRYRIFRHYYERSRNWRDLSVSVVQRLREMLTAAIPTVPVPSQANSLRLIAAVPLLFAIVRPRAIVAGLAAFIVAMLIITWWPQTHYFGPAVSIFAAAYCAGVFEMIRRGLHALAFVAVAACFTLAVWAFVTLLTRPAEPRVARVAVTEALNLRPGGHLVLVDADCEDLTFNAADIDASKIVWANQTADARPLLDYYRDREVWRIACGQQFRLSRLRAPLVRATRTYALDPY